MVPPGTQDAVIISGRSLISASKRQLVWQGSRVLILTERRPGRPRSDVKPGSEDAYAIVIYMGDLCRLDPELSLIVRPVSLIHFFGHIHHVEVPREARISAAQLI